jgi:hypothetical protein
MKNVLACALGILALALWTVPCRADAGGCCDSGCGQKKHGGHGSSSCGCQSIVAASCCDDDCGKKGFCARLKERLCGKHRDYCCQEASCKPSFCERLRARFHKNDCCETKCEKPKCDDCCKPSLKDRLHACFHKKKDCCDSCGCSSGTCGGTTTAPPPPAAMPPAKGPEQIPAPMPKDEKKEQ